MIRLSTLIALQVVLSRFFAINVGSILKFSFGFSAIVLAAYLYGVPGACVVACISDVLGAILFPQGTFFIGYTITSTLTGLILGLFLYKNRGQGPSDARVILSFLLYALLGTVFLNTFFIAFQYCYVPGNAKSLAGIPARFVFLLPKRVMQAAVMLPVQCIVTELLIKPRRSETLHKALIPVSALLMTITLKVDISSLRPMNAGEAFVSYLSAQIFSDPALCAALFLASLALTLYTRKFRVSLASNIAGLILGAIFTFSAYFFENSSPVPGDPAYQSILFCCALGAFALFRSISTLAFWFFDSLSGEKSGFNRSRCTLAIFVCALPCLLLCFPGTLTADAYDQLNQFMGTAYPGLVTSRTALVSLLSGGSMLINDSQSVVHTLLLGGFYWLFYQIGSGRLGIYFFILLQLLCYARVAARSLELLNRAGVKHRILFGLCVFYVLFPLWPLYFCSTFKESLLAIALLCTLTFFGELILFPEETVHRKARLITGCLSILLCLLLRSFTALLLLPLTVYAVFAAQKQCKKSLPAALISCAGAYALWVLVTFLIFPLAGVGKGPGVESRSLMLQQTALYAIEDENKAHDKQGMTEDDWALLEQVYGTRDLAALYQPADADGVKFYAPEGNDAATYENNALHYTDWQKYDAFRRKKLFADGSDAYLRAALSMAASYWDLRQDAAGSGLILPLGDYGRYENGFDGESGRATEGVVEIGMHPWQLKIQRFARSALLLLSRLPFVSLLFKSGTYLYACLLGLIYAIKARKRGWIFLLTLVLYGVGLCFGPISGSSRYAFPILFCAPSTLLLGCVMAGRQKNTDLEK